MSLIKGILLRETYPSSLLTLRKVQACFCGAVTQPMIKKKETNIATAMAIALGIPVTGFTRGSHAKVKNGKTHFVSDANGSSVTIDSDAEDD